MRDMALKPKQTKKDIERSHALQAAFKLGEEWTLEEREAPDFLVSTNEGKFGLEVTECFIGPKSKAGSKNRAQESANQRWLRAIRDEFEDCCAAQLHLRYLGHVSKRAAAELLAALLSAHFEQRADFDRVELRFDNGSVWAYKSPNPHWMLLKDRVGWVSQDGTYLQREIDAKSPKLNTYRQLCPDIRLLVVADRIYNSGKLELADGFRPDLRGFDAVYFFSYPMSVTPFYRVE